MDNIDIYIVYRDTTVYGVFSDMDKASRCYELAKRKRGLDGCTDDRVWIDKKQLNNYDIII